MAENGSHQKGSKLPTKEQKEISAISSKVKSNSPHPRGQVKALCTKGEVISETRRTLCYPRIPIVSVMSASEHVYWSYVSHPSLIQLVDWMDTALATFSNDSAFMTRP